MRVIQIPVGMIIPNPEQPRKIFTDSELGELTNSIREFGVLQPLLVKKAEGKKFNCRREKTKSCQISWTFEGSGYY